MKRTMLALALASLPFAAFAGPPNPGVIIANTPLPVDVATQDVDPLAEIGPNWGHTGNGTGGQCERTLPVIDPVAIYEVFFALAPSDPMPPDNAQCFARVFLSEDGTTFHEIAKFAVPAVGPEPLASCDTEVKLYTRAD
jgi:hypothetical protein